MMSRAVVLLFALLFTSTNPAFCADATAPEKTLSPPKAIPATTTAKDDEDDDDEDAAAAKPATTPAKPTTSTKPSSTNKSNGKSSKKKDDRFAAIGKGIGSVTARAAGIATGFAVGVPVAAVRVFIQQNGEQKEAVPFIGESKNPVASGVSRMIVIPSSFFSATVQAPLYSAINAWRETEDQPFSKESFFLGDLEERTAGH